VLDELTDVEAGRAPNVGAVIAAPPADISLDEPLSSWVLLPRRAVRDGLGRVNTKNQEKES
jgi:hypothetical protein